MMVSAYRITNEMQEKAMGAFNLASIVPPELQEKALAYLGDCGRFYYVEGDGTVTLITSPTTSRQRVEQFTDRIAEMLRQVGVPVAATRTTTGSAKLQVTWSGTDINIVITAAR